MCGFVCAGSSTSEAVSLCHLPLGDSHSVYYNYYSSYSSVPTIRAVSLCGESPEPTFTAAERASAK